MKLTHRQASAALTSLLIVGFSQAGCGIFLGNVKPVDEKSETYSVMDLSVKNSDWAKIPASAQSVNSDVPEEASAADHSDVVYQSKKTASIIALNSACRPSNDSPKETLTDFSNRLFFGISDISLREEKSFQIQNTPALRTTVQGKLNQESMRLQAVVIRNGPCVYDLMFIARPERFSEQEADFTQFLSSFHFK